MVINGRDFTPEILNRIQALVKSDPLISRTQLSRQVCEWLEWRNAKGKLQDMSCRVALLKLEQRGFISLPVGGKRPPKKSKRHTTMEAGIEETMPPECRLPDLGRIELIKIGSVESKNSRIWNGLMQRYHYLGEGPLCGAQMRYLIRSERYGFVGGFAFSAAALKIAPRDRWIGWEVTAHKKNLNKVIGNSRFLIIPRIPHLASHVLALMVKRIALDWQERYGIRPVLLETFIEQGRFKGTCYQAANWIHLGETRGRGRQDSACLRLAPVKDIYVYPLSRQAQKILCDEAPKPVLKPKDKEHEDWAQEEFGKAELGDRRLVKRLVTLAHDFGEQPQAPVPQACGTHTKTKAAYRFFEHAQVSMETLLKPHYESTLNRLQNEKIVLAVQDTTTLNYSPHPDTKDLGLIGSHAKGAIGLLLHDTLVFNPEGTPLGLLDIQCWVRDPALFGKNHLRKKLPIEEKESYKWLKSFMAVVEAQKRCPQTRLISVGDREADIYDLFALALSDSAHPLVLARAQHDRLLSDGQIHVWEHIAGQPLAGIREVKISRRGLQKSRTARLEVRFGLVALSPPQLKPHLKNLTLWAVMAQEIDAPEGVTPLKWMLLTTSAVTHFEQAQEVLDWYCIRFGIEIYHKTLKSGCKIEARQLGTAKRLKACLAIDLVVAWRVFNLTKLGREVPDVPCTVFFEEEKWKALAAHKTQTAIPPAKSPGLGEAMRMTASLGGFIGRKGDGAPGTKTIWIGLQRLEDIVLGWKVAISTFAPHLLPPPVSRVPRYG